MMLKMREGINLLLSGLSLKRFSYLLFTIILCLVSYSPEIHAQGLSQAQLQLLQSGVLYFDEQTGCSPTGTTTSSTSSGSSSATTISYGPLSATVYLPPDSLPHPLVIFAPGRNQNSHNGFYDGYLARIAAQGFVVAGINFRQNSTAGDQTNEVQDIQTMVQKLPTDPTLNGKLSGPIGLIGHSDGAMDVMAAGYGSNQINGVSAVIAQDGAIPQGGIPNSGPPLLLMHGTADKIQPISSGSDSIWPAVKTSYKGYAKFLGADHYSYITGNVDNVQSPAVNNSSYNPAVDAMTAAFLNRFLNGQDNNSTSLTSVAGQYANQISFQEQGSETPSASTPSSSSSTSTTTSTCCSSSTSANVTLIGSSNIQEAFNFFVQQGLSPEQSAGLVGNMDAESGLFPGRQQGQPATYIATSPVPNLGFGIVQWTSTGRQANLVNFAQEQGKPVNDLGVQLAFAWQELNTSYSSVLSQLKSQATVDSASDVILNTYEIAADHTIGGPNSIIRRTLSEQVLKQYGGTAANISGSSAAAQSCSSSGTTTASGTYQNPLRDIKQLRPERIDQGIDYAGQGPVYALGNGTIENLTNSGWNFGGYDGFIVEKLSDGPAAGDYVYVAEGCVPSGSLSIGEQVTTSTVLCNMINPNSTGIETGWATGPPYGASLAMQLHQWDNSDSTALGQNYSQLLQSLGAPAGVMQGHVTGSLPTSGWTNWQTTVQ